jgi:antitoxin YefM
MLSLEEFNSLTETAYLLRSPQNALRIFSSIEELEQNGGSEKQLIK